MENIIFVVDGTNIDAVRCAQKISSNLTHGAIVALTHEEFRTLVNEEVRILGVETHDDPDHHLSAHNVSEDDLPF